MAEGARLGVRVVCGCEFSVAAAWGEMHLLGYFLPTESGVLEQFLVECRGMRQRRAEEMVARLRGAGQRITMDDVMAAADGGAVGRPHVARALVRLGQVRDLDEAFHRFIGRGRVAFVPKDLPSFAQVADLVHQVGGIVSAAHLRDRGTQPALSGLKAQGLDAVETRHPGHHPETRARLTEVALDLGLLRTGGSDWHGDGSAGANQAAMGSQEVPAEWLGAMERRLPAPPVKRLELDDWMISDR